jgi:4-hydroxy-tetrahydrodipicolinate reductase
MGRLAATTIDDADDLCVAALVDPGDAPAIDGAVWVKDVDDLDPATVDVLVDFTVATIARRTLAWVVANAKDAVVGTSGLQADDLDGLRRNGEREGSRILIVPNFSIGAVLLERFAASAAPHFTSVEVVELHHDGKRDAPSGTSIATATAIAASRARAGMDDVPDRTAATTLQGARGAGGPGGVRVHSVRLPGLVAHQEVLFGSPGEGLTLRHDVYDRQSYMAGLLLALRNLERVDGVCVGLEHVLEP